MGSACSGESVATVSGTSTPKQEERERKAKLDTLQEPTRDELAGNYLPGSEAEARVKAWQQAHAPTSGQYVQNYLDNRDEKNPLGFSVAPPPESPDLTSQAVKMRRASQTMQLLSGRGRRSAFLGQGYAPSALSLGEPKS